jgi:hypothetical protein
MLFRRRTRTRAILLLIAVLLFLYWRGSRAITKENELQCKYHFVYAVCKQTGQATEIPSFWDVIKNGASF